eukprot:scpid67213/ scgid27166/ 
MQDISQHDSVLVRSKHLETARPGKEHYCTYRTACENGSSPGWSWPWLSARKATMVGLMLATILCGVYVTRCAGPRISWGDARIEVLPTPKYTAQNGRFLYLVTGEGAPGVFWVGLSQQRRVHIVFATWKYNVGRNFNTSTLQIFHNPDSTWASCRNFLYTKIPYVERRIGERVDFIVFADEDLALHSRSIHIPHYIITSPLASTLRLQDLLMQDQPARASVEYAANPKYPMKMFDSFCVQSCAFDGALDIYHRSIINYFLPYSEHFDPVSWQMAQYIMNVRSQSLLLEHCNLYREVFIDASSNKHGHYPTNYDIMDNVTEYISDCLLGHEFRLVPGQPDLPHREAKLKAQQRPTPKDDVRYCTVKRPRVDYSLLLANDLAHWPLNCPNFPVYPTGTT